MCIGSSCIIGETVAHNVCVEVCGKFFVWHKGGHRPRYAHETYEEALNEAIRLAKANPGKKFIVQQFLEKVCVEPTVKGHMAMPNNKIWFAGIRQNQDVAFRFFDSKQTVDAVRSAYPDKITGENVGCLPTEGLNTDNLSIISSVQDFENAPTDLGVHNTTMQETSLSGQSQAQNA